jgi:molecular chaperone DnaK
MPQPRGMPQIEVTFDVDANGIMKISAKDKTTGKENKITIKSDGGLSKDQIEKMIREAEANAEEDRKQREIVDLRNSVDGQVHQIRKDLKEVEDKISSDDKAKIETSITALLTEIATGTKESITQKMSDLAAAAQVIYTAKNAQPQQQDKDITDVDFTEVKTQPNAL